ncbi:MAG: NUDIX hydrolase [Parcubacteria group bacterium GW2011_GWA2_36_10]|nr:MAG: NUDIX hydrolase [Parcubacteria group bacterium GW2011_GWA2_36_10]
MKKLHLGVYGIILLDNKILLIKKARGPYIGLFDLPGGSIEHGEDIGDALKRELKEELSVAVLDYSWFTNYTHQVSFIDADQEIDMHHVGLIYKIDKFDLKNLKQDINFEDVAGAEFLDLDKIDENLLSQFAKIVLKEL